MELIFKGTSAINKQIQICPATCLIKAAILYNPGKSYDLLVQKINNMLRQRSTSWYNFFQTRGRLKQPCYKISEDKEFLVQEINKMLQFVQLRDRLKQPYYKISEDIYLVRDIKNIFSFFQPRGRSTKPKSGEVGKVRRSSSASVSGKRILCISSRICICICILTRW